MNSKISEQEWQIRQELAASYRLFVVASWNALIWQLDAEGSNYRD